MIFVGTNQLRSSEAWLGELNRRPQRAPRLSLKTTLRTLRPSVECRIEEFVRGGGKTVLGECRDD